MKDFPRLLVDVKLVTLVRLPADNELKRSRCFICTSLYRSMTVSFSLSLDITCSTMNFVSVLEPVSFTKAQESGHGHRSPARDWG